MVGGINIELLKKLKEMPNNQRIQIISGLDLTVLYKLLIRMGYTTSDFNTLEKRNKVINEICSDEKIEALIEMEKDDKDRDR